MHKSLDFQAPFTELPVKMASRNHFVCFALLLVTLISSSSLRVHGVKIDSDQRRIVTTTSPFEIALESLQRQINYTFQSIGYLRRAMTHPSFSEENNKALSILGANVIETSVSLHALVKNIDISAKELNRRVVEISNVDSCALDGTRLGLHKVVRVSPKTNSTASSVVCGAYRAIFGSIAIDTGKSDDAGTAFWRVHGGVVGRAFA